MMLLFLLKQSGAGMAAVKPCDFILEPLESSATMNEQVIWFCANTAGLQVPGSFF